MFFNNKKISDEILELWKELYKTKYNKKTIIRNNLFMMMLISILFVFIAVLSWGFRNKWEFGLHFWIILIILLGCNLVFWIWQTYNKLKIWSIVNIGGDETKLPKFIHRASGRIGPNSVVQELEIYKKRQSKKINKEK